MNLEGITEGHPTAISEEVCKRIAELFFKETSEKDPKNCQEKSGKNNPTCLRWNFQRYCQINS